MDNATQKKIIWIPGNHSIISYKDVEPGGNSGDGVGGGGGGAGGVGLPGIDPSDPERSVLVDLDYQIVLQDPMSPIVKVVDHTSLMDHVQSYIINCLVLVEMV